MTVEDLIEELKKFPKDMEVVIQYRDDGGYLIQRWLSYDGFEFKVDFWKEIRKPDKKE